ncbi:hypothetical protein FISHEDRAFT_45163 [Fistulina hepatica ATCC 64428]|uniref:RRM domain-containing protein n=1 Tax=Fistulina hepatica ATCC 64428 TaxID=1128425 RepID=A0A0D7A908_9AGAR|nr:hypothetical protein FISHEDRAFT_45163 [Fistulina hepatica ATCC 64428]
MPNENTRLIVSNLHYEITVKNLTDIFGAIGTLIREPYIRYDRSGRSTGVAIVMYETAAEAQRAISQYNNIEAKGQPMTVQFDTSVPRRANRASSTSSLLERMQTVSFPKRASQDDSNIHKKRHVCKNTVGPIRTSGARGGGKTRPVFKKQVTAEELDKELDAFMEDATPGS